MAGPKAGEPVRDIKNGFHRALELAEIQDVSCHDLQYGATLRERRPTLDRFRQVRSVRL
jgi:hypothetical protein